MVTKKGESRTEFENDRKGETGELIAEFSKYGISLFGPFTTGDDEYYEIAVPSPNGLEWRTKVFTASLKDGRREAAFLGRNFASLALSLEANRRT